MKTAEYPQTFVIKVGEIIKVSKEELIFWANTQNLKLLQFKRTNANKGILFAFLGTREKTILGNGEFVHHAMVDIVLYTSTDGGYKKFLIYDPHEGKILGYKNNSKEVKPGSKIFFVNQFLDRDLKKICEKIEKKRK
ncbi:MAG: hypothetical protein ABH919_02935 [bacterium]